MKNRRLGKTEFNISEVALGTWQLGGRWGDPFDEKEARNILEAAYEKGINFIDTADVYNGGKSEKAIGEFIKAHKDNIYVATKCGRRLDPHATSGYNEANIRRFAEDSLKNLDVEKLDLLQLHCPPTEVFHNPEVFYILDCLKQEGKILNYGVSVERIEEGLKAMDYKGVASIQIIFNMFRQRPAEVLFERAQKEDVGIIARVPLASGLLTGKFDENSTFNSGDHRFYNRNGERFSKGETFSGVEYEKGLMAVNKLKEIFKTDQIALYALKWILMFDEVTTVIPGASRTAQVNTNVEVEKLPDLTDEQMKQVKAIYEEYIKEDIHHLW
ncbi:aldo/keto reductase [Cellulosilyticum sp. I15G10I2]|uniref:aldo/keto reductase n=1 Tax=Cellulosilyticum sp. I15G10I2 TaxID=1892843 RepID=UPI00085C02D5|nr:aldo/keto reductase [Cellulosilyticum sp. I15G10I2]